MLLADRISVPAEWFTCSEVRGKFLVFSQASVSSYIYKTETLKVPEGVECDSVSEAFGTMAWAPYSAQNKVAIMMMMMMIFLIL